MDRDTIIAAVAQLKSLAYKDLTQANLRNANLRNANLYGADLYGANLRNADLYGANLRYADLYGANLRNANLYGANLYGANLRNANLYGANLYGAKDIPALAAAWSLVTPETGPFWLWKKLAGDYIAQLSVPETAKRSSATTRKCRVSEAVVLAIFSPSGQPVQGPIASLYDSEYSYKVGETVTPRGAFEEDRWNECASGIHGYLTRVEAENH